MLFLFPEIKREPDVARLRVPESDLAPRAAAFQGLTARRSVRLAASRRQTPDTVLSCSLSGALAASPAP